MIPNELWSDQAKKLREKAVELADRLHELWEERHKIQSRCPHRRIATSLTWPGYGNINCLDCDGHLMHWTGGNTIEDVNALAQTSFPKSTIVFSEAIPQEKVHGQGFGATAETGDVGAV